MQTKLFSGLVLTSTCLALSLLSACNASVNVTNSSSDAVSVATPTPSPTPSFSLDGKWLSLCYDFGGGAVNQVFADVSSNVVSIAILTWDTPGCTGTYTISDSNGAPAAGPMPLQNIAEESVSGIPANFHVFSVIPVGGGATGYVVAYVDGTNFYELITYSTPHNNWADWLAEPDVVGFVANPSSYVPSSVGTMSFSKVSAMP